MSNPKFTRTVVVTNPEGVHARAATQVRLVVLRYRARVEVIKGFERVDPTNVLQMLSLCAGPGDELVLEATGEDAEAVLEALARLFDNKFEID